jgi:catechol 2,3-dioxygenase-like lactoylglutathione lyase family enzyme
MIKVSSIGHATFETTDLPRMVDYYQQIMGLTLTDRDTDTAYLASPNYFHSVVLKRGTAAQCKTLTLQIASDGDLNEAAKFLTSSGVNPNMARDAEPSAPLTLSFAGPDDIQIALIQERRPSPRQTSDSGIAPRKLGHIAFNVHDVQSAVDFFVKVLGFRVSDWMGDFFAFLRCGPDHHTVNLLPGKTSKMHHIAFEANDWNHIRTACDLLGQHDIPLIWGPGRHGIGHNIFIYHHTPDGQIMELYTDLDQMSDETSGAFDPRPWHKDKPQRPKIWQPGLPASNIWGIPTPPVFRE